MQTQNNTPNCGTRSPDGHSQGLLESILEELDCYADTIKVADIYDQDEEFSQTLNNIPDFEYPDFSWMTVLQVKRRIAALI